MTSLWLWQLQIATVILLPRATTLSLYSEEGLISSIPDYPFIKISIPFDT